MQAALASPRPNKGGKTQIRNGNKRTTVIFNELEDKTLDALVIEVSAVVGRTVDRSTVIRTMIALGKPKTIGDAIKRTRRADGTL